MSKLVILKFGEGNFGQGFSVTLQISKEEKPTVQEQGKLPPRPEILELYQNWWSMYTDIGRNYRKLEKPDRQVTNVSTTENCQNAGERLSESFNDWLQSSEFLPILNKLREQLIKSDTVRILIETDNIQLQRLPWHQWDLLDSYHNAEIAISPPRFERVEQPLKSRRQVKILAILGESTGIDIEVDRQQLLQNLPGAEVEFLKEPQRLDINDQLWESGWDILFFTGHSETDSNTGRFYINANDSLTIADLKFALRRAIAQGLKIAIFNSCDGLGLARNLADLDIPQVIVMRERVPDRVAQEFLKFFLKQFSQGESFYLAVRRARERLQGLEKEYPCASWLPVIYQNPTHKPPTWQDLFGETPLSSSQITEAHKQPQLPSDNRNSITIQTRFLRILIASLLTTGVVLGFRQISALEKFELTAYDQLIQLRPQEKLDDRILVVEATEQDIHKHGFPLPDAILAQAIDKLDQYQPQIIGLDIFRNVPREPGHAQLVKHFKQNNRLIAICRVPDPTDPNNPGIAAPPAIAAEGVGFADVVVDSDKVLRRHLLFLHSDQNSICTSDKAFSVLLALNYLAAKGIEPEQNPETKNLQLGSVIFTPLPYEGRASGYRNINGEGTQILLNYRADKNVAPRVTLSQVLNGQIKPETVQNRIVIIGVTARTAGDSVITPYGEMPGVLVQAHGVSQILSTVLDQPRRPLLGVWSLEAEILWIWGWSLIGGVLLWRWRSPLFLYVAITTATIALTGLSLILLIQGSWVPFVPSVLALVITSGCIAIYKPHHT